MINNRNRINSFQWATISLLTLFIAFTSINSYGQVECNGNALSAEPQETFGCPRTITYTFTQPSGMVGSPQWETSGSEQPSGAGSTVTVAWMGASGTRYVRVRYAISINGVPVEHCSEKSYTITETADPPIISVSPSSICEGETVTLNSTGGTLIEFQWALVGTENWTAVTGSSVMVNSPLRFRSRATMGNCGEKFSTPMTVSVESRPNAGNMTFVQGSNVLPYTGGGVQFELTNYSSNANLIRWQMQVSGGAWQDLNGGFQQGHHRYPLAGTHSVTQNTTFRAIAKSNSGLGCESPEGMTTQSITISEPPPPPPNPDLSGPTSNVCQEKFHTYTLSDPNHDITGTFQTSWSITGDSYEVLPSDYSSSTYHTIQVKWLSGSQGIVRVDYHSTAHNITGFKTLSIGLLTPGSLSISALPDGAICLGTSATLTANGGSNYTWSGPGIPNPSANSVVVSPAVATDYQLTGTEPVCNLSKSVTRRVEVLALPEIPSAASITYCDWEQQELRLEGEFSGTYSWYSDAGMFLGTGRTLPISSNYNEGAYNYQVEAVRGGCVSPGRGTLTLNVTSNCDHKLNRIETKGFDQNGMISNTMQYFDYAGQPMQSQTRTFQDPKIFLSQHLEDRYGRVVGTSLSAPSTLANFKYQVKFVSSGNRPYDFRDFDDPSNSSTTLNPLPVNDEIPGTLGWYYSSNNTWEKDVPKTDYPYSRSEFYDDATGETRRSAGAGDNHRLGAGHEVLSGTFPIYNELDDYLTKRRNSLGLSDNLTSSSLVKRGVQSVVRDQNGNYAVSITDQSGKTVFSARKGTPQENVLTVPVSIISTLATTDANYRPITYFYLLDDQTVTISSGDYTIENIVSGTPYTPNGSSWSAGFYRIILNSGTVTLSYSNYFLDVSYQFYDDAGRLKSSLSPNGFQQLKSATPPSYSAADQTSYTYNHQGWLLSMREPDAGVTNYKYRLDGQIRFSQNAEQLDKNRFSYTHYDQLGRPIESGEYFGTQYSFATLQGQLEYSDQVTFSSSNTKDWVKTYYDSPVGTVPNLPTAEFKQEFVRGAVSSTENVNIQTWYSYDELGRVVWMAQKPKVLNRTFVTQYTYDFLGNVLLVRNSSYMNSNSLDQFFHHYTYDADNRLHQAFTSKDGTTQKLRATYEYYLHGPLKRIELGDNLQGIDFVYNIHGWLTQINHPDNADDPGEDGIAGGAHPNVRADVFGMVLDYYESSMTNLYSAQVGPSLQNLQDIHGLPDAYRESYAAHQPLIRFNPIQDPSPVTSTPNTLKEFSAENPRYKDMLSQD